MKVLAGGGELLGRGVLKVPDLVLHPVVELVRVLLPLQVELAADSRVLIIFLVKGLITYYAGRKYEMLLLPLQWKSSC